MKNVFAIVVVFLIVMGIGIGSWFLWRNIHYRLAYEKLVQETVKEMVKPEALKPIEKE